VSTITSLLSNRHVVLALLVAPVLAVLAWYGVELLVGTTDKVSQVARLGESYPLLERSGCRYAGGTCQLSNGDFTLTVTLNPARGVSISSALPLESLLLGLSSEGDLPPLLANPVDSEHRRWFHTFKQAPTPADRLRVVAVTGGSAYFGEASLVFIEQLGD